MCAVTNDAMERARAIVSRASAIAVLTGSGISAESGVPTFRGAGGLWRTFRPEDLATSQAFERDPKLVWEWYDWRRGLVAAAQPNPRPGAGHASSALPGVRAGTPDVDGLRSPASQPDPPAICGPALRDVRPGRKDRRSPSCRRSARCGRPARVVVRRVAPGRRDRRARNAAAASAGRRYSPRRRWPRPESSADALVQACR